MIKLAIVGYGNLGKGVETAVCQNPDMELVAVFTRRNPETVKLMTPDVPVLPFETLDAFEESVDVLILCGGSATDLPEMTPALAAKFNVVDSFDNHSQIPAHIARVHAASKAAGKTAIVSCGWDPGMFSLARVYAQAALPQGESYTFWGPGLSQGHSDAVRRIPGVLDARQYTVPVEEAIQAVRAGDAPQLTTRQKHKRECFVVAAEGADKARIEREIKTMPNYFADYNTTVTFVTAEELLRDHSGLPHGGSVIRTGVTGWDGEHCQRIQYELQLDSNPEFTASVLVAYARAIHRMHGRGVTGCQTVFDVAPADLSPLSPEELRAHIL